MQIFGLRYGQGILSLSHPLCVYTYLYENVIIHKDTYMIYIFGLSFQTMKPLLEGNTKG